MKITIKRLNELFQQYEGEIEKSNCFPPMEVEEALGETSSVVSDYLRSNQLYIDGDYLIYDIEKLDEWRFISKVVWEAYEGVLADSNIWEHLGLGGDDDVDYNSSYIDGLIEPLNWLIKNNKI